MKIKLLIIIVIIIGGGTLLLQEDLNLLPNEIDEKKDKAVNNMEETLDNTVNKITTSIDDTIGTIGDGLNDIDSKEIISAHGMLKKDESVYYGQVFEKNDQEKTCQVSVPEMAQTINGQKELTHILSVEDCKFDVNDSVRITSSNSGSSSGSSPSGISKIFNSNSQPNPNTGGTTEPTIEPTPSNLIFDTLSLSTIRYQDSENIFNTQPNPGDVQIRYEDTSGRTTSVTVTLKNSEQELFSGVFHASAFTTSVNDISDSPHILEMVVEHADHGTITSSVFNPTGNFDNEINGIFIKPN